MLTSTSLVLFRPPGSVARSRYMHAPTPARHNRSSTLRTGQIVGIPGAVTAAEDSLGRDVAHLPTSGCRHDIHTSGTSRGCCTWLWTTGDRLFASHPCEPDTSLLVVQMYVKVPTSSRCAYTRPLAVTPRTKAMSTRPRRPGGYSHKHTERQVRTKHLYGHLWTSYAALAALRPQGSASALRQLSRTHAPVS